MFRRLFLTALIAAVAVPLAGQTSDGWKVRIDKSTNASDPDDSPDLKFMVMGKGFHVTGGPAGTFWNPSNNATGNYTVKATFNLLKPSNHTNYYGLVFGGSDLDGPNQNYLYFVVAQNGRFQIRQRAGEATQNVQAPMAHEAIRQPGADGRSTNVLEVRVAADAISYAVNGTVVHTSPKSGLTAKTDGIAGFRANHMLDVHVEGFEIQKGA
jgi:hypothetical protein